MLSKLERRSRDFSSSTPFRGPSRLMKSKRRVALEGRMIQVATLSFCSSKTRNVSSTQPGKRKTASWQSSPGEDCQTETKKENSMTLFERNARFPKTRLGRKCSRTMPAICQDTTIQHGFRSTWREIIVTYSSSLISDPGKSSPDQHWWWPIYNTRVQETRGFERGSEEG